MGSYESYSSCLLCLNCISIGYKDLPSLKELTLMNSVLEMMNKDSLFNRQLNTLKYNALV